jgi:anaerobic magnesium-protoporphyrin IX monomethyl ester cyclase
MRILLTHGYFLEEDEKEKHIMKPYVPLGILYISAFLEQQGYDNKIFDSTFSNKDTFYRYLSEFKPGVIGIYTNLMTKLNVLKMIQHIKTNLPDTIIVLGGPEIRASAENFLQYGADITVIGEGEMTMLEIVEHFSNKRNKDSLYSIAGIAFLEANQFIQTPERQKIADVNTLPFPNRNKVDLGLYLETWKKFHGKNAISVSTMRGCPYSCKWCSRAVYGMSYRRRSAELVAEELQQIYDTYSPDSIWFVDDVFTINHKWLNEFNAALKKRNLLISYECITRADRLNEEVIRILKESGCFRVWIGAESGSQKVIDLMDRRVKVNQVRDMIRLSSSYGIETGTFIMLGYPGETEADIKETIHHLKSSNPDHFTITVAYPIKGTELYKEVESLKLNNVEWHEGTDRDVDFKRTYSRRYYDHAVKHVVSEVNYHQQLHKRTKNWKKIPYLKMQSLMARGGMILERMKHRHSNENKV